MAFKLKTFFQNIIHLGGEQRQVNPGSMSWSELTKWMGDWNESDEPVTERRAMRIATVNICIGVLAESIASLPYGFFERSKSGKKTLAIDHPAERLVRQGANGEQSWFQWMNTMIWHAAGWGEGRSHIERDQYGEPAGLQIMLPWNVEVLSVASEEMYYRDRATGLTYPSRDVLIYRRYSLDGKTGLSPIMFNNETMGFALKQNKYRGKVFGTRPPGYLTSDSPVTKEQEPLVVEQAKRFKAATLEDGSIAALTNGLKYQTISFNPAELQMLEMSGSTKEDILGIFRVPPVKAMIYTNGGAPFNSSEQQNLSFLQDTLMPWLVNIEQENNRKLLSSNDSNIYGKFNMNGMLRADIRTRFESYRTGINNGFMNADQVAELEDWDPIGGEHGPRYYMPMNMIPADRVDDLVDKATLDKAPAGDKGDENGRPAEGRSVTYAELIKFFGGEHQHNGNGKH